MKLNGQRHIIDIDSDEYPASLLDCRNPPEKLYVIGSRDALDTGIAIVGARKATPYGLSHSEHFASIAASRGIPIISGGALGCDSAAHKGALKVKGKTVVVLGGGCDQIYPAQNRELFQKVIDTGGAVISENDWDMMPIRWTFRARNRIIAGLASATLIIEAGLPSGTFSTADEALAAGREVLSLPGAITSKQSHGSNQLIFQGAMPVIDDDSFNSLLDVIYPNSSFHHSASSRIVPDPMSRDQKIVLDSLKAQSLSLDEIHGLVSKNSDESFSIADIMMIISALETTGKIAKYPDGRYGPTHSKDTVPVKKFAHSIEQDQLFPNEADTMKAAESK